MAFTVEALAEAERPLAVAAVRNNGLGPAPMQLGAQFSAIVGLVAEHMLRWLHSADQALSDRAVVCFASSQQDGDQAPFSICECMDLRVAPTSRAANSLFLLPLFRPMPSGGL